VTLPLQATAWRLREGHSLQLVLCADGWPSFWPAPHDTEVFVKDVHLSIPTLAPATPPPVFAPPQAAGSTRLEKLRWLDAVTERIAWPPRDNSPVHTATTAAHHLPRTGTDYLVTSRFQIDNEHWQGRATKVYRVAFERPGWSVRIDTRLEVTSTPDTFEIAWTINAEEGGQPFHRIEDRATVPRTTV
jgi:hypothetical protein